MKTKEHLVFVSDPNHNYITQSNEPISRFAAVETTYLLVLLINVF